MGKEVTRREGVGGADCPPRSPSARPEESAQERPCNVHGSDSYGRDGLFEGLLSLKGSVNADDTLVLIKACRVRGKRGADAELLYYSLCNPAVQIHTQQSSPA